MILLVFLIKKKGGDYMLTTEEAVHQVQKQSFDQAFHVMKKALDSAKEDQDILKQKHCANYFDISVNTLKNWVAHGCPEIRLESGMVLYSKKAIHEWLLSYQI